MGLNSYIAFTAADMSAALLWLAFCYCLLSLVATGFILEYRNTGLYLDLLRLLFVCVVFFLAPLQQQKKGPARRGKGAPNIRSMVQNSGI